MDVLANFPNLQVKNLCVYATKNDRVFVALKVVGFNVGRQATNPKQGGTFKVIEEHSVLLSGSNMP